MRLQPTLIAVISPGEESGYFAECLEHPVVTQGATLDEVAANLREAVSLQLSGEDPAVWGLVAGPTLVVTSWHEPQRGDREPRGQRPVEELACG